MTLCIYHGLSSKLVGRRSMFVSYLRVLAGRNEKLVAEAASE